MQAGNVSLTNSRE